MKKIILAIFVLFFSLTAQARDILTIPFGMYVSPGTHITTQVYALGPAVCGVNVYSYPFQPFSINFESYNIAWDTGDTPDGFHLFDAQHDSWAYFKRSGQPIVWGKPMLITIDYDNPDPNPPKVYLECHYYN